MDHVQGRAVNGYEGGDNSAEWQEMAMARDESESEREGEGIHDLLVRMPGHLSAKGKEDEGEDEGEDEEHPGPEPSNAEVADDDEMDEMDTASHEEQAAEMV